jgi:Raf kinase inhibitor-like YbhB/YbcL family protein
MPGDSSDDPREATAPDAWRRPAAVAAWVAAIVAVVAVALGLLAACGPTDDGRALRTPSPDQTTSTATTSTTTAAAGVDAGSASGSGGSNPEAGSGSDAGSGSGAAGSGGSSTTLAPMRLSSSAIATNGRIPVTYTCRGEDVSPPLLWAGVPAGTVELAVVVRDASAEGFVHWVITAIPATTGGIAEATPPAGAVEAANDFGRLGWAGPCPPSGTHDYEFVVYALGQASGVTAGQAAPDAAARVEATPALSSGALRATASAG